MSQIARQIRTWAMVKQLELDALEATAIATASLSPDEGGAETGLAIGSPLPSEHQRLRAMLRAMMGGPARGT